MAKKAFITGITGQDGSYLAELLLRKGYDVHGIVRRASTFHTTRLDHIKFGDDDRKQRLFLHYGDMTDSSNLNRVLERVQPDEIYNLAAQSHVQISFEVPEYSAEVDGIGVLRLLDAIRETKLKTRFYQASSSELFGRVAESRQSETTPFYPRSPYAAAKLFGYWIVVNYREAYNLFACNGILFNHESPRRGENFVTRKVTHGIAQILAGKADHIDMGNMDAQRDWGFAPEYVEAMWKMLQAQSPVDYVIGTGRKHSVKEFIERSFAYVGLDWKKYIRQDPRFLRLTEVDELQADASKAAREIGWQPKVGFEELIMVMVDADMRAVGLTPVGKGDRFLKEAFPSRWWEID